MKTQENTSTLRGNTISLRARRWCITLNNYTDDELNTINTTFSERKYKYIIGKEVGSENNTPHLQIYIESKNAISFNTLKNICQRFHIEKAKGNKEQNLTYCSKENNFITNFVIKSKIRDPLENKPLYPWQNNIIDIINQEADLRKIYWFWDIKGGSGKTSLAKHICLTRPNQTLFLNGKGADIKYGVKSFIDNDENELKICIFHFTRSVENYISYEALESIKDGIFYNSKYESGMVLFNPPHIICFANFEPETSKLSEDRWVITELE